MFLTKFLFLYLVSRITISNSRQLTKEILFQWNDQYVKLFELFFHC